MAEHTSTEALERCVLNSEAESRMHTHTRTEGLRERTFIPYAMCNDGMTRPCILPHNDPTQHLPWHPHKEVRLPTDVEGCSVP